MGFLDRFRQSRADRVEPRFSPEDIRAENGTTTNLTADQLVNMLGLTAKSAAGMSVTADTAMRVSAVYGCVSLLAGAIASMPLGVFQRDGEERKKASHDYWWLFNEQANENMTAAAAWEYLISSKLFYGDGFAELLRPSVSSAKVIGWKPHHPLCVTPIKDERGSLYYRVQPERGAAYVLDSADMIHLPSLGFDGCRSPSPITYAAREAVGTSLAADSYVGEFFSGGASFDFALKTAATLKPADLDNLYTSLRTRIASNSRTPLVLSGGLEPAQISVNSKDAEILATRMFNVEEICRIFGVPPHMVGHTDKTTSWGSGVEQMGIGFVRYTLQRILTPAAQELNRKLWPVRQKYFVEHITAALERGDLKARYEAYRIALGRAGEMPWVNTDEIRRLENMPPDDSLTMNQGTSNGKAPDQAAG